MTLLADLCARTGLARATVLELLAHVGNCTRAQLIAHPERVLDHTQAAHFAALSARVAAGEPLAYVLGTQAFYGRTFYVSPDVLIPRPETEVLIDAALSALASRKAPRVLDLGTGSGVIAITLALERPDAQVHALDRQLAALAVAEKNAQALQASVTFLQSDWFSAIDQMFDLIVANPPYIAPADPHLAALGAEPRAALVADDHGLADLTQIARAAGAHLSPSGTLLCEHGYDQAQATRALFHHHGLVDVYSICDLAGIERICHGRSATERRAP